MKCLTVVWPGPSPSLLGKPKFIFQGILGKKKKKTHLFWKDLSEGQARPIPPFLTTQTACLRVTWGLVEMRILGSSDT